MIAPMSRVEVIFMSEIRPDLVEFLQRQGLLHIEDVPLELETDDGIEKSEILDRMSLEGDELAKQTRYEDLERTISEVIPLLTPQPSAQSVRGAASTASGWSDDDLATRIRDWADRLRELTREKIKLQDTITVLSNYQTILEQVAPALGKDVKLGKGSRAVVLHGNVDPVIENLQRRFKEDLSSAAAFHYNRMSKRSVVGLITFPEERGEEVSRVLSQEGVAPVDIRDESLENASVQEVMDRVRTTLQQHHARVGELNTELNELSHEAGPKLAAAKPVVNDRVSGYRIQRLFGRTEMLTVLHGWIPKDQLGELRHAVNEEFHGKVTVSELDLHDVPHERIPTQLRNPAFFRPFELVLKLFNPPTYGSLDPTILIGVSFTLFYGFIVGDVVYGVAILAFAVWLANKLKRYPVMADVRQIGIYMGVSTMIFGVLYGEYAGFAPHDHPRWIHRDPAHPNDLLIWALYFGVAHLLLSLSLGVYENWRHHHMHHALEKLGALCGLTSLIIVAFRFFDVSPFNSTVFAILAGGLFITGAVLMFATMCPMMGAIGVLEFLSLGGNVISYARLMALGLAAVSIALQANTLPDVLGPVIGIPLAILVHIINIGISIASPTIHAMRLNVVEFLPKFFSPAGKEYAPFKKETQS